MEASSFALGQIYGAQADQGSPDAPYLPACGSKAGLMRSLRLMSPFRENRSLRTIVAGGSVPSRALLEAAATHVCKDIICRYGTTELGLVADASAGEVVANPGLIGRVVPDIELAVFDTHENRLPFGQAGFVKGRIKSWIGTLPAEGDHTHPWIDVGDVGWVTNDSRYYVIGRRADIGTVGMADAAVKHVSPIYEVEHLLKLEWDTHGRRRSACRHWLPPIGNLGRDSRMQRCGCHAARNNPATQRHSRRGTAFFVAVHTTRR